MGKRGATSIFTDAQWDWVAEKYKEGYSAYSLADFLGMTTTPVYNQIKKRGVVTEGKKPRPLSDFADEFNRLGDQP